MDNRFTLISVLFFWSLCYSQHVSKDILNTEKIIDKGKLHVIDAKNKTTNSTQNKNEKIVSRQMSSVQLNKQWNIPHTKRSNFEDDVNKLVKNVRRFQKTLGDNFSETNSGVEQDLIMKLLVLLQQHFTYISTEFHIFLSVTEERSLSMTKLKKLISLIRSQFEVHKCNSQCHQVWEILQIHGRFLFEESGTEIRSQEEIMRLIQALEKYSYYIKYMFQITFSRHESLNILQKKIQEIYNSLILVEDYCTGTCYDTLKLLSSVTWLRTHVQLISEERLKMLFEKIRQYEHFIQSKFHISITTMHSKRDMLNQIKHLVIRVFQELNCRECKQIKEILMTFRDIMTYVRIVSKMENLHQAKSIIMKYREFIERTYQITFYLEESEEVVLNKIETLKKTINFDPSKCGDYCKEIQIAILIVETKIEYFASVTMIWEIKEILQRLHRFRDYIKTTYHVTFHSEESIEVTLTKIELLLIKVESDPSRCTGPCTEIRQVLENFDKSIHVVTNLKKYFKYIEETYQITFNEFDSVEVIFEKIKYLRKKIQSTTSSCASDSRCNEISNIISKVLQPYQNFGVNINSNQVKHLLQVLEIHREYIEHKFHIIIKTTDTFEEKLNKINQIKNIIQTDPSYCSGINMDPCAEIRKEFAVYIPPQKGHENEAMGNVNCVKTNEKVREVINRLEEYKQFIENQYKISISIQDSMRESLAKIENLKIKISMDAQRCVSTCAQVANVVKRFSSNFPEESSHVLINMDKNRKIVRRLNDFSQFIKNAYNIQFNTYDSEIVIAKKIEEIRWKIISDPVQCFGPCKEIINIIVSDPALNTNFVKTTSHSVKQMLKKLQTYRHYIETTYHIVIHEYESQEITLQKIKEIWNKINIHPSSCVNTCREIRDIISVIQTKDETAATEDSRLINIIIKELDPFKQTIMSKYEIVIQYQESYEETTWKIEELRRKIYFESPCSDECNHIKTVLSRTMQLVEESNTRKIQETVNRLLHNKQYIESKYHITFSVYEYEEIILMKIRSLYKKLSIGFCDPICQQIKKEIINIKNTFFTSQRLLEVISRLSIYNAFIETTYKISFQINDLEEVLWEKLVWLWERINSEVRCAGTCIEIRKILIELKELLILMKKETISETIINRVYKELLVHQTYIQEKYSIALNTIDSIQTRYRKIHQLVSSINSKIECDPTCLRISTLLTTIGGFHMKFGSMHYNKYENLLKMLQKHRIYIESNYRIYFWEAQSEEITESRVISLVRIIKSSNVQCTGECIEIREILKTYGGFTFDNGAGQTIHSINTSDDKKMNKMLKRLKQFRKHIEDNYNV